MKRMKKMKSKITLTFAIIFLVAFIITGFYSVISLRESFFSCVVIVNASFASITYLFYVWWCTNRHKIPIAIGMACISLMMLFAKFFSEGIANSFSDWNWKDTVTLISCVVLCAIADLQAEKLLEEKRKSKHELTLKGDIKPEDVEV